MDGLIASWTGRLFMRSAFIDIEYRALTFIGPPFLMRSSDQPEVHA